MGDSGSLQWGRSVNAAETCWWRATWRWGGSCFNGAAALTLRKRQQARAPRRTPWSLQWGRSVNAAETKVA